MRYHRFSILLHWVMMLMIIILFLAGWYMEDLPTGSAERTWFFAQHKSLGLTVGLLAFIRLGWRFATPPPALPKSLSRWQARAAHLGHTLLYAFMFLQPLSGYLSTSFSGYKTRLWGAPLPHWGWKEPPLNLMFSDLHDAFSMCLLAVILVHVGAVILHLWQGGSVLGRMLLTGDEERYQPPVKDVSD